MIPLTSIQIIGTQRSGSNLLRLILNQFPEISAPHPPHVLKTFIPLLPYYGDLRQTDNLYLLAHDIASFVNANPVPWNHNPITAHMMLIEAANPTLLSLYEALYKIKARQDKAVIWCCKSMFNEYYAEDLEREGIRPHYIYLYRDGRDVAVSFRKTVIGPKHVYHVAKKWVADQKKARQVKEFVGSERFYSISYESLVNNPEEELLRLSLWLGLPYSSDLLAYHRSYESKKTAASGEMWKNVSKPIISNNVKKYKKELTRQEIKIFESVAFDMLQELGYCPDNRKEELLAEFSPEEIDSFNSQDKVLQEIILRKTSKRDLAKRNRQEEIIQQIQHRFGLM